MDRNQLIVGTSISLEKVENGRIWELLLSPHCVLVASIWFAFALLPRVPHLSPLVSPTALGFGSWSTFPWVGISLFVSALSSQPASQGLFHPLVLLISGALGL